MYSNFSVPIDKFSFFLNAFFFQMEKIDEELMLLYAKDDKTTVVYSTLIFIVGHLKHIIFSYEESR